MSRQLSTLCVAAAFAVAASETAQAQAQSSPNLPPVAVNPPTEQRQAKAARRTPPPAQRTAAKPKPQPTPETPKLPAGVIVNPSLPVTWTTAGPVQGYRALSATSATKTDTAIERIPQSIQVIPRSVIDDQKSSLTVSDILRNVSNVQGADNRMIANTDPQPLKIRGFGAEQWLDGLPVFYNTGDRDSFVNVERIEVLKGPSAILYGGAAGAPIGGAVNIVSKLPTDVARAEAGFKFGSYSFLQPYFDVNQPLTKDGTALFRFTGEYTSANSSVDVLHLDRYSFNPTLTLTNKEDTTLTIQGRASRFEQQAYPGLPVMGTIAGSFRVDPNLFAGPSNIPRSYTEVQSITTHLDHSFNEIFSADVNARVSQSKFEQNSQLLSGAGGSAIVPLVGDSVWALANSQLHQDQKEFTVNPSVKAKFRIGPTDNTVLVGGDYTRATDKAFFNVDYLGNSCTFVFPAFCPGPLNPATTVDLRNPVFNVPFMAPNPNAQYFDFFGVPQVIRFNNAQQTYTTSGAYAQLQSTIFDRVHVLAGIRQANVKIDYVENSDFAVGNFVTETSKALPRVGAVVDLVRGLSVYASYSEGLRGVPFTGVVTTGKQDAEQSKQAEAGIKFNVNGQLSGTAAFFRIERTNVPVSLGVGGLVGQANQKSRGFEADLIYQPDANWQFIGSFGYVDAIFADSLLGAPAGNKFPGIPAQSGRLWANYKFDHPMLRNWSIGAGVYAASGQYVDNANVYRTSAYHTFDAKLAYDTKDFSAAVSVRNLTNEKYFVPYVWLGGQVAPGEGRGIYGSLAYRY